MSESTTMFRPDQFTASSQEPLVFDTISERVPEFSSFPAAGADSAEIAEANMAVQDALGQASDRLVFPDEKRGHFEITQPESPHVVMEASVVEDAWREQIEARRLAAAQEAEARATERELTASISADAQAMTATRDYVTINGINAE